MLYERALPAPGRARLGRLAVAAAVLALALGLAAPARADGPITSLTTLKKTTLRTGVTLTHYRANVSGYGTQQVYLVSWQRGNSHVRLGVSLFGRYMPTYNSVDVVPASTWYTRVNPPHFVASINGEFSYYTTAGMRPSGIGISNGHVYWFGWSGPGVGYSPGGRVVFGRPAAVAAKVYFPGGKWATVGAWNGLPAKTDQVGVYTRAGQHVSIPSGYVAAVANGDAFSHLFQGTRTLKNSSGLGVREKVRAFVVDDTLTSTALPRTLVPLSAPAPGATSVTVPTGGGVIVAAAAGSAGQGVSALLARSTPRASVLAPEASWASVTDVMGGKPQLVTNGVAVSTRPAYVDTWQWSCGGGCWRTALGVTASGKSWFAVAGATWGGGVTMPVFARMLKQLGAVDAMGFDNNGSTELFRPLPDNGTCNGAGACVTGYGYERSVPLGTALYYR